MQIKVRDVPHLPFKTRFPGLIFESPHNFYDTVNWPDITDEDVTRWHKAGFISVEGVADGSAPEANQRISVTPEDIKSIVTGGAVNG